MEKDKLHAQTFLTADEYNKIMSTNKRKANCLSFALGQTSKNYETFDLLTLPQLARLKYHLEIEKVDICEAFIKKAKEFGYTVKQIPSLDGTTGQIVFIVFGWYTDYIFGIGIYEYFFHIMRKNEDDTFEHKQDWLTPAKILNSSELNEWLKTDIKRHYFVVS